MTPGEVAPGPDDATLRASLVAAGKPPERVDEIIAAYRANERTNGAGTNGSGVSAVTAPNAPLTDEQVAVIAAYRQWLTTVRAVPPDVIEIDYVTDGTTERRCALVGDALGDGWVNYALYVSSGRDRGDAAWMYRGFVFYQGEAKYYMPEHWEPRPASAPPDEVLKLRDEYDRKRAERIDAERAARRPAGPVARPARSTDAGALVPLRRDSRGTPTFALLDEACEHLSMPTPDSVTKNGRWEWYRSSSGNYGVCVNADGSGAVRTFDPEDRVYFDAVEASASVPQPAQNDATGSAAPASSGTTPPPVAAMLPVAPLTATPPAPTRFHSDADAFGPGSSELAAKASEAFLREHLAASGIDPLRLPAPFVPIADHGVPAYRIHYPDEPGEPPYIRDRLQQARPGTPKYLSPPGSRARPYLIGSKSDFAAASVIYAAEGEKKIIALQQRLGGVGIGVGGNWGFTESGDAEIKSLHHLLLERLSPGQVVLYLPDGDWRTNEQVATALATWHMELKLLGVRMLLPDLGLDAAGTRLGADDWLVLPEQHSNTSDELLLKLRALPRVPVEQFTPAATWTLGTLERFKNAHTDFNDQGNAVLLRRLLGDENVRYIEAEALWAVWDTARSQWRALDDKQMLDQATIVSFYYTRSAKLWGEKAALARRQAATLLTAAEANEKANNTKQAESDRTRAKELTRLADDQEVKAIACDKWAKKCGSKTTMEAMRGLLAGVPGLRAKRGTFDQRADIVATPDGVIELRTGLLRPEVQVDYCLKRIAARWPTGGKPDWKVLLRVMRFLTRMTALSYTVEREGGSAATREARIVRRTLSRDITTRDFLLRVLATCLWGNAEQRLFFLLGDGGEGKTLLLFAVQRLLGDYGVTIPAATLLRHYNDGSASAEGPQPYMASLEGARGGFLSEANGAMDVLHAGAVKSATGGDVIPARGMYKGATTFSITATLLWALNKFLRLVDFDKATLDRICVLKLHSSHNRPDSPVWRADWPDADVSLWHWLREDEGAQSALLWLMVRASMDYAAQGLRTPKRVLRFTTDVLADANDLAQWLIDEDYVIDVNGRTPLNELYDSYKKWCQDAGVKHNLSRNSLKDRMADAVGTKSKKMNVGQVIFGVRARTEAEVRATPEWDAVSVERAANRARLNTPTKFS